MTTFNAAYIVNPVSILLDTDIFGIDRAPHAAAGDAAGLAWADMKENIQDLMNATLVGGSNISVTYNDPANTLTIAYTGAAPPADTDALPEGVTNLYFTDERAQDAVGLMVDSTLVYVDATPLLTRAALTGDVTAAQSSNATTIAAGVVSNSKLANMAQKTVKGRADLAGTGAPTDLTGAQLRAVQDIETSDNVQFGGLTLNTGTMASGAFITALMPGAPDPAASILSSDSIVFGGNELYRAGMLCASDTSASSRAVLKGTRSRGNLDSPSAASSGDFVFSVLGAVYDGATIRATAGIEFITDGAISPGVAPQYMRFSTGATTVRIERMRISSGGATYFPGVGTTASASNAFLNSGSSPANQLLRSTSSLIYKTGIEDVDPAFADRIFSLRPVYYRSRAAADDPTNSYWGLIAEQVAGIDPRLVSYGYQEADIEYVKNDPADPDSPLVQKLKPGAVKSRMA